MKIFYLIYSLHGGGAENAMVDIGKTIEELRHEIKVYALTPGNRKVEYKLKKNNINYELISSSKYLWPLGLLRLYLKIRKNPPDCIWTSLFRATIVGQVIGKIQKIPVISWQHSTHFKLSEYILYKLTHKWSNFWIADCLSTKKILRNKLFIPSKKIEILKLFYCRQYNGFKLNKPKEIKDIKNKKIRVGIMGRLDYEKGYDYFLRTILFIKDNYLDEFSKLEFLIAGDGKLRNQIKDWIVSNNIHNVYLLGYQDDVYSFLNKLDIYVQPSRYEGLCVSVLQAMELGLPIVGFEVGGIKESVENGVNGFLCNIGDIKCLSKRLVELVRKPEIRKKMGRSGREKILSRYTYGLFREKINTILQKIQNSQTLNSNPL